jgi:hypothetical protein
MWWLEFRACRLRVSEPGLLYTLNQPGEIPKGNGPCSPGNEAGGAWEAGSSAQAPYPILHRQVTLLRPFGPHAADIDAK